MRYLLIRYIYRLPPLPPTSKKSAGDDFRLHFGGPGSPGVLHASLLWQLECTGVARRAKVGYLAFRCRRQLRFRRTWWILVARV